jgi:drug/metabolite transporter (DMT)-like permease
MKPSTFREHDEQQQLPMLRKPDAETRSMTRESLVVTTAQALLQSSAVRKYAVQGVFLFTGVFSTCAAQYVFYQGAGDQKAMLLPLCNYLGIMLVGLIPMRKSSNSTSRDSLSSPSSSSSSGTPVTASSSSPDSVGFGGFDDDDSIEPERTSQQQTVTDDNAWEHDRAMSPSIPLMVVETMELTRRQGGADQSPDEEERSSTSQMDIQVTPTKVYFSFTQVQLCIFVSVVLDFAGCIFSNIGLSMAGSGLYQVVYSSVICWSALMSRFILKKQVSKEEWMGIALVTFGLAFSALGGSNGGRNSYVVMMGCFNTLIGAAFYGGNYVTGEYTLKLPERPEPKELCLKLGTSCVAIIAVYQIIFVLPEWHELVTKPIAEANGSTSNILTALIGYTLSQLAHGLTYFMMLGSSGAVTTGIMQSLRAVCVFAISSVLYCSHQESQCFDTRRGIATLIVVSGVMFYSWAKSQAKAPALPVAKKQKMVAGKNHVV